VGAHAAWICILSPLVGAALTPILARIHPKVRDVGAVLFAGIAALCALSILPLFFAAESLPIESKVVWLDVPFQISFGIFLDQINILVANVVAVISFLIMVYCVGYMKDDPNRTRFWMWMNCFIGSMLLLVLANNLLFLFIGWKLVGVCSYGLIGYYYVDEQKYWIGGPAPTPFVKPSQAAIKALVVTGAGDMAMLGGILIMFYYSGTLDILALYETLPVWLPRIAESPGMLVLLGALLLAGPVGKSAQFPLHEWLPEAMAGPGPVSALIHAATMVKSGVYLVARLLPIFYYGTWVLGSGEAEVFFHMTAWVGGITAFLAASQGLVALELKKALAYSTVSQIGYMMLGLGVAGLSPALLVDGYTAGLFHLMSHAMFKACLFLCAGSVIHSVHSIYMHEMGGVRRYMRKTWLFMLVAALSLMGFPFVTPGFWSKDLVLMTALEAHLPLFAVGLVTAGITAFYTVRMIGMVFYGPRSEHVQQLEAHGHAPHEAHPTMWFACGVLALLIVGAGFGGSLVEHALHGGMQASLVGALALPVQEASGGAPHWLVPALSIAVLLCGAIPGYLLYIRRSVSPARLLADSYDLKTLHRFLWRRWHIDAFYNKVFVGGTTVLARLVAERVENTFDDLVHRKLPTLVTRKSYDLVKQMRTDTGEIVSAVSYILVVFVFLLVMFFLMAGS
jgi:NADH-quinone oxidoreductase subunit L